MSAFQQPPRTEFERKFLVVPDRLPHDLPKPQRFVQGYLRIEPLQERIRFIDGKRVVFQIKGPNHFESTEMEMPIDEAKYLLNHHRLEGTKDIEKDWYVLPSLFKDDDGNPLRWEIHLFFGENHGLVIAEIEFPTADFRLDPKLFPEWVGTEVTEDPRFKNKRLALKPFSSWPAREREEVFGKMGVIPPTREV